MNSLLMIKFNINILFVFSSYLTIGLTLAGVGLGAPTKDKSAFCRNSPKKYFFSCLLLWPIIKYLEWPSFANFLKYIIVLIVEFIVIKFFAIFLWDYISLVVALPISMVGGVLLSPLLFGALQIKGIF